MIDSLLFSERLNRPADTFVKVINDNCRRAVVYDSKLMKVGNANGYSVPISNKGKPPPVGPMRY